MKQTKLTSSTLDAVDSLAAMNARSNCLNGGGFIFVNCVSSKVQRVSRCHISRNSPMRGKLVSIEIPLLAYLTHLWLPTSLFKSFLTFTWSASIYLYLKKPTKITISLKVDGFLNPISFVWLQWLQNVRIWRTSNCRIINTDEYCKSRFSTVHNDDLPRHHLHLHLHLLT